MKTHFSSKLILPVSERDHISGPASAPVTLVEYGDYECPYCGLANPIVDEIRRELGNDSGSFFATFR
jgi:protein-disulfide isomerase